MVDSIDDLTLLGRARNNSAAPTTELSGSRGLSVQPQSELSRSCVRAVADDALVRKNRTDFAIEVNLPHLGRPILRGEDKGTEAETQH